MSPIHRLLIKTHHMTSRKKILAITKAAKRLSLSVVLKTGGPPGIMLAEGEGEGIGEWGEVVRKLRYKDHHLLKREAVPSRELNIEPGTVLEVNSMKQLGALLEENEGLYRWWREAMGYGKGQDES